MESKPKQPSRAPSSYFIFCQEERAKTSEKLKITDLSAKWKEIDGDEKERIEKIAEKGKKKYEKAMEAYVSQ